MVNCKEIKMTIPTYCEAPYEELPIYAEGRTHQRTGGNPYPNKVIIHTYDREKKDVEYNAILLENEYIELIILPELGGRIFSAYDKRTDYYFFYRQHVVKPALIGDLGSWISGGIEFNFPFHHRPSTFMPVDYSIEETENGGKIVWMSEHDPFDRLKGMVGICLESGQAYFETRMKVYNRTPVRRSFLWWENTAVPVNPQYEIFFPEDVDHVWFHYRDSVTGFPVASGSFNGYLYGDGTDISKHFNTKHATSYFAAASEYDYFGGYDNGKECGVVHIGDAYVSPGKKMFTWGYEQLSRSWERALTDEDGAYAELMAGSYSDNQPDFAWIEPYETKNFSQCWYPITKIGVPDFANLKVAYSIKDGKLFIQPTVSAQNVNVSVSDAKGNKFETTVDLSPDSVTVLEIGDFDKFGSRVVIGDMLAHCREKTEQRALPELAVKKPTPDAIDDPYTLVQTAVHLTQYRDPIADPSKYCLKALEIRPNYAPALEFLGELAVRKTNFAEAVDYFERALKEKYLYNRHAESGRTEYLLGYAYEMLGELDKAYSHYRFSAWNADTFACAMTRAAAVSLRVGNPERAEKFALEAIERGVENSYAMLVLAATNMKLGRNELAAEVLYAITDYDKLYHSARYLLMLIGEIEESEFYTALHSSPSQTCLDIYEDLTAAGLDTEAMKLLEKLPEYTKDIAPTVAYLIEKGELLSREHRTFPFRDIDRRVLLSEDAKGNTYASYLYGCQLFSTEKYDEAAEYFAKYEGYEGKRNLAVYYYKKKDYDKCLECLDKALEKNPGNEQLVFEKAYVRNHIGYDYRETAEFILENIYSIEKTRDDICAELAGAYSACGEYEKALDVLSKHVFIVCEGGETFYAGKYISAWAGIGEKLAAEGKYREAADAFARAQVIPENIGAGIWHIGVLVPVKYRQAECLEKCGEYAIPNEVYDLIESIQLDFFSDKYLPELAYYKAMARYKRGDKAGALEILEMFEAKVNDGFSHTDSGWFAAYALLISYPDLAPDARKSYYGRLAAFCKDAREKIN
ncbi:MAG: DUF5107 domain-containing protein [Clostridia bacterium]|nr:DUF5107 domain-containing protein [Clostridia bacterium]